MTPDVSWCFYDPYVCPSEIAEGERVDCYPDDVTDQNQCLQTAGCMWCKTDTEGKCISIFNHR